MLPTTNSTIFNALIAPPVPWLPTSTGERELSIQRRQQQQMNTNNWHWTHYHKPYQFGSKNPNFHDYENLISTTNFDYPDGTDTTTTTPTTTFTHEQPKLTNYDRLAQLSCDSGEMILRLNFSEPFKGIVYPDHNRLSPCRFFGDGHHNYELRLPLRGCGTKQVSTFFPFYAHHNQREITGEPSAERWSLDWSACFKHPDHTFEVWKHFCLKLAMKLDWPTNKCLIEPIDSKRARKHLLLRSTLWL